MTGTRRPSSFPGGRPVKPKEGQEALTSAARTPGRPGSLGTSPTSSIRFYSSSTDAVRARRPTDLVLFLLAAATLGMVSLFASRADHGRRRAHPIHRRPPGSARLVLGDLLRPADRLAARVADRVAGRPAPPVPAPRSAGRDRPCSSGSARSWRGLVGDDRRPHGVGSAGGVSGGTDRARDGLDRDDRSSPRAAAPTTGAVGGLVRRDRRRRARRRAPARGHRRSGDRVRVRGARASRVRIARRTAVVATGRGRPGGAGRRSHRPPACRAGAQGRRPAPRVERRRAVARREGLRTRRVGRPAAHVDVVLPLVPGRIGGLHPQPAPTGGARGVRDAARGACGGVGVPGDRGGRGGRT